MIDQPWRIWQFCDGKAGHERQTEGLIAAIARLRVVETWRLLPLPTAHALVSWISAFPPVLPHLPAPHLIIGAGHRTHLSLLAARRTRDGRAIVCMRPSMPHSFFDLCLIPAHDSPPPLPCVLATQGVLNTITPSQTLEERRGLFLIGGPSVHFGWDQAALCAQIIHILAATPQISWALTTSRRTPASFLSDVQGLAARRLHIVPAENTTPEWLPMQLAQAATVWVSEDSVSMVYEALTAGGKVGLLRVPEQRRNRVSEGVKELIASGWVTPFDQWQYTGQLFARTTALHEAERVADWLVRTWHD